MYKFHTRLNLIEGGNRFKQGDRVSLSFSALDSRGEAIDLENKNIQGEIYSSHKGVIYEKAASYDTAKQLIIFQIDRTVDYGTFQIEFTVTDPSDADYRLKIPSDPSDGRINILGSTDNMDFVGVKMTTVSQLRSEIDTKQQQFEAQVNPKVQQIETEQQLLQADYQAAAANLTQDSEVILARGGEVSLGTRLNKTAAQLAEKVGKTWEENLEASNYKVKNFRNPTLVANQVYPNLNNRLRLCWADGDTLYSVGEDNKIRKSTDNGVTWILKSTTTTVSLNTSLFKKLSNGTFLAVSNSSPVRIYRSTNDCATWTLVFTLETGVRLLGSQSWCEDVNGNVFIGEYHTLSRNTFIYISRNDGQSFETFKEYTRAQARHIHSCIYDEISQKTFICTGDSEPQCGIFMVNDAVTDLIPVVLSDTGNVGDTQKARAIGLMFFEDYLVWGMDSTSNPHFYRIHRNDFGDFSKIERLSKATGTVWWTQKASNQGGRWVVSVSNEGNQENDAMGHILMVENNGLDIYEMASFPNVTKNVWANLSPVGYGGDNFALTTYTTSPHAAYICSITNTKNTLPAPAAVNKPAPMTIASGIVSLAASESLVFMKTLNSVSPSYFYLYNFGATNVDAVGKLWVRIRNETTNQIIFDSSDVDYRNQNVDYSDFLIRVPCIGQTIFSATVYQLPTGANTRANAFVTYGWGMT